MKSHEDIYFLGWGDDSQLGALPARPEDPGSVPNTHSRVPQPQDAVLSALLGLLHTVGSCLVCIQSHRS